MEHPWNKSVLLGKKIYFFPKKTRKKTRKKNKKTKKKVKNFKVQAQNILIFFNMSQPTNNVDVAAAVRKARTTAVAYKYWMVTINNPTDDDLTQCRVVADEHTVYSVFAKEVGESGTPHVQGFIALKERMRLTALSKLLKRAYLAPCKGSTFSASMYCKKGEQSHDEWDQLNVKGPNFGKNADFVETGDITLCNEAKRGGGAKRNNRDMAAAYDQVIELAKKHRFEDIDAGMMLRFHASIKRIAQDHPVKLADLPFKTGHWYYGPPRTGKSRTARAEHAHCGYYDKPCNKWWDGYRGEDVVIIDDFDLNHKVLSTFVKRWTDHYAFPGEMKGTTVQIRPLKVIITSNYTPEEIWADDPVTAQAVRERCTFKHFAAGHAFRPTAIVPAVLPERPVINEQPARNEPSAELAPLTPQLLAAEDPFVIPDFDMDETLLSTLYNADEEAL